MRCSQRCSGTWSCLPSPENKHQEISLTKLGRLWNSQPLGPLVQLKPEDMCCLSLAMLEITQTTSQFSRTSQITLCGVTSIHTMMLRRTHTMKTEDIFFFVSGPHVTVFSITDLCSGNTPAAFGAIMGAEDKIWVSCM